MWPIFFAKKMLILAFSRRKSSSSENRVAVFKTSTILTREQAENIRDATCFVRAVTRKWRAALMRSLRPSWSSTLKVIVSAPS